MTGRRMGAAALAVIVVAVLLCPFRTALSEERKPGGSLLPADLASGLALGGPVNLSADTIEYNEETGVAVAEGNVEVGFGKRLVRADRIRFDAGTGEAEFAGHVRYEDSGDEFSFDRIVLNIRSEMGVLHNGSIRIRTNDYRISSERFEKTGPRTFLIRKGTLTTCPCEDEPDWKFKIGRSRVTLDGYAVAKDVTFHVKGVPVLWLPWGAFPVKLTRQSGLLVPSFSRSPSKGYSFLLPYYWAVSRWSDATLSLEAMSRRGYRPEAEYRFVLNRESEGAARASWFRDNLTGDDRYRIYGENRFRHAEGFTANARWDIRSDDRYYEDLVEEDVLRTGRHTPSRGFGSRQGPHDAHALSVVWVQDNQGTPDDNTVQRLPEYAFTLLPRTLGGSRFEGSLDLSAAYFYRTFGDREVRGRGLATLSRAVEIYPSVSLVPYGSIEFYESLPTSDRSGTEQAGRALPTAGATLEMDLRRDYISAGGKRFIHQVSPVAAFRWVPQVDQSRIPLTEYWSRVGAQNQFTFTLTQRVLRTEKRGPFEMAFLELSWAVDARKRNPSVSPYVDPFSPYVRVLRDQIDLVSGTGTTDGRTDTTSDIFGRFFVAPAAGWKITGETLFDPGEGDFTIAAAGAEYRRDPENAALLEYRTSRGLTEDLHGVFAYRPFRFLGLNASAIYSLKYAELTEGSAGVTLYPRSDCWSIGFVAEKKTRPDETGYKVMFSLKGVGSI